MPVLWPIVHPETECAQSAILLAEKMSECQTSKMAQGETGIGSGLQGQPVRCAKKVVREKPGLLEALPGAASCIQAEESPTAETSQQEADWGAGGYRAADCKEVRVKG